MVTVCSFLMENCHCRTLSGLETLAVLEDGGLIGFRTSTVKASISLDQDDCGAPVLFLYGRVYFSSSCYAISSASST